MSLDDDLVSRVGDPSRFLGVEHVGRIRGSERGFVVAGYAHATTRKVGNTLIGDLNTIIASRYSGDFDFIMQSPVDPERDLFLQHTRLAATLKDSQEPTPHLGGISGASVWAVLAAEPPAQVWTVRDRIRLVAIETAMRQGTYIRATRWRAAAEVIRQVDPVGAAQIIEAIEA